MKAISSPFAVILVGFFLVLSSQPLSAAALEPFTAKPGAPVTRAEWDKLVADAKKEGKLVIYAGPIGEARSALSNAFREKFGITVDIVMSKSADMVPKIEAERRAGIYAVDVGFMGMESFFGSASLIGFTQPVSPLLVLPEILDLSKWREKTLPCADKACHLTVLVLGSSPYTLINTGIVKPGEINSHQDLLDPKWRGKLIINDPSVGGAGSEWFTFILRKVMGIEKGTIFMKQLAQQAPAVTRDQRLLSEWVARGKYAVALAPDKATTAQLIRTGAPVAYIDLKEPRPTTSGPGNLMVFNKSPHPSATKLFVNWILSKEGATVYSKAHGYPATRIDVPTDGIDPFVIPKPSETMLGEDYQSGRGEIRKLAAEVFRDIIK